MMVERVTFNAIYYGETWLTFFRGNTEAKNGENGYNTEIGIIDVYWSAQQKRKKYK